MRFHNKNQNYQEEEMSGIQRGTIQDPTEFEKKQMEWSHDKIKELRGKVEDIIAMKGSEEKQEKPASRKPVVPTIPFEQQFLFWNCLNDIQYGQFNPEALTKVNTWVVQKDGTWLVQKNRTGYYAVKKNAAGIPTLPVGKPLPTAFFDLAYGKIPNDLLLRVVAFFRDIMKRYNDAEAFIQIYWDKTEAKYIINVPKQRISKGSVNYDATENLDALDQERYVFVYECHSHNSMGAFWSGTDNRDEKELRIYGVFGMLHTENYANKHRFFVGEEQVDVDMSLVFDIPKEEEKKYLVTHNNKQYMVNGDKLILDDKPKYLFENDKGEKFLIPLESVSLQKTKVDFPETWFKSINVPSPSYDRPALTRNSGEYGVRQGMGGSLNMPNFPSKKQKDPFYWKDENKGYEQGSVEKDEEEEIDADQELLIYEMGQVVKELCLMTNDFEDPEATYLFLESVAEEYAIDALFKAIKGYQIKSGQFEQGPSDGRY
jgi:PRTRC genetic system protein A